VNPPISNSTSAGRAIGRICRLACRSFTLPTTLLANPGGYTFAEAPERSGKEAVVAWTGKFDPACVQIKARRCRPGSHGWLIDRFADRSTVVVTTSGHQHVSINDGLSCWRFDVLAGSVLDGPVHLDVVLNDLSTANRQLVTIQQLVALHNNGGSLNTGGQRARSNARIVTALRVSDALREAASYREIAIALFGEARVKDEWHGVSDSMRLRVRRLAGLARRLANGGWRSLLR
jgi:hypothetical protein